MAQAFLILDPATELLLHVTWTPPPRRARSQAKADTTREALRKKEECCFYVKLTPSGSWASLLPLPLSVHFHPHTKPRLHAALTPIKGLNQAASLQATARPERLKFNVGGGAIGCGLVSSSAVRKYPVGLISGRLAARPGDPQGQGGTIFFV